MNIEFPQGYTAADIAAIQNNYELQVLSDSFHLTVLLFDMVLLPIVLRIQPTQHIAENWFKFYETKNAW